MAKASRSIAKSEFVERNLELALAKLTIASAAGDRAVAARSRDAKKVSAAVKRLAKRRTKLVAQRKRAKTRAARSPGADTRKALRAVVRELAGTSKALTKARAAKAAGATELKALKAAQRRASGYRRAIAKIDRTLGRKRR